MRLRILHLLAQHPMYGQQMADALGVTPPTISRHLTILRAARLIRVRRENAYHYCTLDVDGLSRAANLLTAHYLLHLPPTVEAVPGRPSEAEERSMVQDAFFEGDRVRSLPTDASTWRFVLERVAPTFEWGRIYTEPELNAGLKVFHEDVASLRRALVDSGILMRDRGQYWLTSPQDPREKPD